MIEHLREYRDKWRQQATAILADQCPTSSSATLPSVENAPLYLAAFGGFSVDELERLLRAAALLVLPVAALTTWRPVESCCSLSCQSDPQDQAL